MKLIISIILIIFSVQSCVVWHDKYYIDEDHEYFLKEHHGPFSEPYPGLKAYSISGNEVLLNAWIRGWMGMGKLAEFELDQDYWISLDFHNNQGEGIDVIIDSLTIGYMRQDTLMKEIPVKTYKTPKHYLVPYSEKVFIPNEILRVRIRFKVLMMEGMELSNENNWVIIYTRRFTNHSLGIPGY